MTSAERFGTRRRDRRTDEPAIVIAIDAGTTSVRAKAVAPARRGLGELPSAGREFAQHYPQPGWVEHDAAEIWEVTRAVVNEVVAQVTERWGGGSVAAIGITNQRETVVAWDRRTGRPCGPAIVWQDRRTAERCAELAEAGALALVRARTGLVLDPYFSASKMEWILRHRQLPPLEHLALGTVDSWLIWNLTGGETHLTDPTNASRTMLFDLGAQRWDAQLADLFSVPLECLARVVPSSGRCAVTSERCGVPGGLPISGIAGDQQAALFGQACVRPGMTKNTYGTGSFVLMNVGPTAPPPSEGMLTTIAWTLADGTTDYALEGAVFATGATVQWLRDGLGLFGDAAQVNKLAEAAGDNGGVYLVPAFAGLGAPHWDPYARATVLGITRGTTAGHLSRAALEAMAYQTRDVVEAMGAAAGVTLPELRVDGGASASELMLQFQADQLGVTVRRAADPEATARGAALLAGLAEGVWEDLAAVEAEWESDRAFAPEPERLLADLGYANWQRAVERSKGWAR